MDHFPPSAMVYIFDVMKKPGSRVELGAGIRTMLAETPDLLPSIAVDMVCHVIANIAVTDDDAKRLQWRVAEAMTAKMEAFRRMDDAE